MAKMIERYTAAGVSQSGWELPVRVKNSGDGPAATLIITRLTVSEETVVQMVSDLLWAAALQPASAAEVGAAGHGRVDLNVAVRELVAAVLKQHDVPPKIGTLPGV